MNNADIDKRKGNIDQKYIEARQELDSAYKNRSLKDHTEDSFKENYDKANSKMKDYERDMRGLCNEVEKFDKEKAESLRKDLADKQEKFQKAQTNLDAQYNYDRTKYQNMQRIYTGNY